MGVQLARFARYGRAAGLAAAALLLLTACGQGSNGSSSSSSASSGGKSVLGKQAKIEQLPDMSLGNKGAPINILEYASMTCPHCAHFDAEVFPELKKNYIDTGKVFYTFREYPLDGVALRASMVARCIGKDRFFSFIHGLFHTQIVWANPDLWNNDKKTVEGEIHAARHHGQGAGRHEPRGFRQMHQGQDPAGTDRDAGEARHGRI